MEESLLSQPHQTVWTENQCVRIRYIKRLHKDLFLLSCIRDSVNLVNIGNGASKDNDDISDAKDLSTGSEGLSQACSTVHETGIEWDQVPMASQTEAWTSLYTQCVRGYLSEIIGGRYVFGGTIAGQAILNLLMPLAASIGSGALIAARVAMGLLGGALYPSMNGFISYWAPPQERTTLITLCHIGTTLALIILYPFLAVLINNFGWEAAFYVPAAISLAWCVLWFIIVSDSPHNHHWITKCEKDYIISSMGETKSIKRPPVPWRAMLTSLPFWALVIAQFGDCWGFNLLIADLPLYMKEIMGENLSSNAFWSSVPNVGSMIVSVLAAAIGDAMLKRQAISRGTLRKGMHAIGQTAQGVCMLTLSFLMCDQSTVHWVFFVSQSFAGLAIPSYLANYMDLAPNFTGTINGIGNAIGMSTGFLAPMTTGFLVNNQQTLGQWRKIWYIAAGMFLCNLVVYIIFGSGEVQPWNYVTDDSTMHIDHSDGHIGKSINKDKKHQGIEEENQKSSDVYSAYVTNPNFRLPRINHAFE
ncbi:unnamed protein product, partial [Meganyctiphanes norvegica]